jgi:hypothetical protein
MGRQRGRHSLKMFRGGSPSSPAGRHGGRSRNSHRDNGRLGDAALPNYDKKRLPWNRDCCLNAKTRNGAGRGIPWQSLH